MKIEVKDLNLNLRKLYFPFWCKTCLLLLAGFLNIAYSQNSYNDNNKNYSTGSKVVADANLDINNDQEDQLSLPRLAPSVFACSEATAVDYASFTANWSASAGATGYFLDVSTSPSFRTLVLNNVDVGNVITYTAKGLMSGTTYYYRVRAVNTFGMTNSNSVAAKTVSCTSQVATDYETVETSLSGSVKTWITRNLGATANASSVTSEANSEAGCYFQFNRSKAFEKNDVGSVSPFWIITSIDEDSDWLVDNDPCHLQLGGTWRLPTSTEWKNVDANGGWGNYVHSFSSALKLHAAGFLTITDGSLFVRGSSGYYWSSTHHDATVGMYLAIASGCSYVKADNFKANGFSVRCLKD